MSIQTSLHKILEILGLIKTKAAKKIIIGIAIFIVFFLTGAVSTMYPYPPGSNWVQAGYYKAKVFFGLVKVQGLAGGLNISTTRYEFETKAKISHPGVWQITTLDSKNVLAIERSTGLLILMTPENNTYKETVLSKSVFPKDNNGESLINPAKSLVNSNPPVVMGMHFGLGRLLYSLVLQEGEKETACQKLTLFEVPLPSIDKEPGEIIERFSTPCIKDTKNAVMWAGRITTNDKKIFLSVGEQRYDRSAYPKTGMFSPEDLVISKTVFGKILSFDPITFKYEIYSSGHRNAQGLFWDNDQKMLLSSEHGPNGGDEVNIIIKGNYYGWPTVTLGKPYPTMFPSGKPEIKDSKNPGSGIDINPARKGYLTGSFEGSVPPLMSWTPGVGVGNLLRVPMNSVLKDWRGDVLVATMGEEHLHRLRTYKGSVVFDENIPVNARIRDIELLSSGELALSLDQGSLVILKVSDI